MIDVLKILKQLFDISETEFIMIMSLFIILILGHISACIFYMLGDYEYEVKNRFNKKTLYDDIAERPFSEIDSVIEMS